MDTGVYRTLATLVAGEGLERERRINLIRLGIIGALVLVALSNHFLAGGPDAIFRADIAMAILGLACAGLLMAWLRRPQPGRAVHYAAVTFDVVLVTAICIAHALAGSKRAGLIAGAEFDTNAILLYFVVGASAMRFRENLARFAGIAAALALIVLFAFDAVVMHVPLQIIDLAISVIGLAASGLVARKVIAKSRELAAKGVTQELEKEHVRSTFERYVTKEVVDEILTGQVSVAGGQRREVTILFSDIRGFTSMSEKMDPAEVVAILNAYFSDMVAIVFKYGGTVDKFIGDGMMAIFGAPVPQEDHALRAAEAAQEMREALGRLNAGRSALGQPPLAIGVGLHTGECVIGNIGSSERLEYTAIGDTVNTASRIESLTKDHGVDILLSGSTLAAIGNRIEVRELPPSAVKGKTRPIEIFALVKASAPQGPVS